METLKKRESVKIDDALHDDPVGAALLHIMNEREDFSGTASELLQVINYHTPRDAQPFLPKLPRALTVRLKELSPFLRAKGITIHNERTRRERCMTLRKESRVDG